MTAPRWALACSVTLAACGAGARPEPPVERALPFAPAHLAAEGERFARQGDLVRAEQYLASALHAAPSDARILHSLLHVCIGASRLRVATEYARTYLLQRPDAWRVRYLLACIELALGNRELARDELQRVEQLAPRYADTHYLLATLSTGDTARAYFDRYLALAPAGEHARAARSARDLLAPTALAPEAP